MTERSFQECRIVMRKINSKRSQIATAEGNVAKWTKISAVHEQEGREGQAEGTRKILLRAMEQLKKKKAELAAMKFPDSDLPNLPPDRTYDEFEEFRIIRPNDKPGKERLR